MPIQFTCPCGKVLRAADEHAGRRTRCPACSNELTIPAAESTPREPAARQEEPFQELSAPPRASERERPSPRPQASGRDWDEEREADEPERRRRPEEATASSGKALAALLLGLGSFCTWIICGIPALVLAFLSIRDINRSGGRLSGKGLAITGLIIAGLNSFCLCPSVLGVGYMIKKRIDQTRYEIDSMNHMRQLGLAMHNYSDVHGGRLPSAASRGKNNQPTCSWRVEMLPYIEQDSLYRQFRKDEAWDSPANMRLLTPMPRTFESPSRTKEDGKTYYQVLVSPPNAPFNPATSPVFGNPQPRIPASFPDGTFNTILIAEGTDAVTWAKPDDLVYDPRGPLPRFGDPSRDNFPVCLGDGSVRRISRTISEQTLRNAITPADGQVLGPDW